MSRPRVGFLGVGWIGRDRMEAMLATDAIEAVAIVEPADELRVEATRIAPGMTACSSFDAMLDMRLDGVVIATPSALHAEQSIRALAAGAAVFCQKPLGRSAVEVRAVVAAARAADRLLAIDLSYRFTAAMQAIRPLVRDGAIGHVHAVDLTFHNAYGPGKPWFFDRAQSGGGCVIDLGVHLVDLALWTLDFPAIATVDAALSAGGQALPPGSTQVEDFAVATLRTAAGTVIRLACSWRLHAGQEAVIGATFYGTDGAAALANQGGSFYDFTAERFAGTSRTPLAQAPDDWGGRAAADWARRLASGDRYDRANEELVRTAEVLDRIYGSPIS